MPEQEESSPARKTNTAGILMLIATVNMAALLLVIVYAILTGMLDMAKFGRILAVLRESEDAEAGAHSPDAESLRAESDILSASKAAFDDLQQKADFMDKTMLTKLNTVKEEIARDRAALDKDIETFEKSRQAWQDDIAAREALRGSQEYKQLIATLQASDASLAYQILNQQFPDPSDKTKNIYQYSEEQVKDLLLNLDADFRAEIMSFFFNSASAEAPKDPQRGSRILAQLAALKQSN